MACWKLTIKIYEDLPESRTANKEGFREKVMMMMRVGILFTNIVKLVLTHVF